MTRISLFKQKSITDFLVYLVLAAPFVIYFIAINHYAVDVPVWDDYVNPLDMTNKAILAQTLQEKLALLITPMNGHIPFLPRVLLYGQYLIGVTSAIKTGLLVSNFGWMATVLLLTTYCHRHYKITLAYLIPIPFLLLSLVHWEAMDFYSSAFQMYWGSGLFAVAGLIAITSNRPLAASLFFLAGLLCSGGGLAVYPVCLVYLLLNRQWKNGLLFLVSTIAVLAMYVHVNPPENNIRQLPEPQLLIKYILEFMGNLVSNGLWDLSPYAQSYMVAGTLIVVSMIYLSWKVAGHHAVKLIFFYVVIVAAMAGYARMHEYAHPVSRYAMFTALAAACLYILVASHHLAKPSPLRKISTIILGGLSIGLWMHSIYICRLPLQTNYDQRTTSMQKYIESGNPDDLLSWNAQHAKIVLETAREIGIYDYTQSPGH